MNKNILLVICLTLLSACTTVQDLKKIDSSRYFVLEKDHLRVERRGIGNYLIIEGLLAGKYKEFAEDKDGTYFVGEGHPVVILWNKPAEEYQKTKVVKPGKYLYGSLEGGLWLPKKGSIEKAKLFFTIRQKDDGSSSGGLVAYGISGMVEGSLDYVPFDSEEEFLNNLRIVEN